AFDDGKRTAKAITVDHRDGRLGIVAKRAAAPFQGEPQDTVVFGPVIVELDEELLQVHAGAERLAHAAEDQHARLVVVTKVLEHRRHVLVKLRTHGVALFRPIEADGGNAVLFFHEHGLVRHAAVPPSDRLWLFTKLHYI